MEALSRNSLDDLLLLSWKLQLFLKLCPKKDVQNHFYITFKVSIWLKWKTSPFLTNSFSKSKLDFESYFFSYHYVRKHVYYVNHLMSLTSVTSLSPLRAVGINKYGTQTICHKGNSQPSTVELCEKTRPSREKYQFSVSVLWISIHKHLMHS